MGQTADDMRREIERTRRDMGNTLDAIGDRVSPGRIVERRTARVRHGFRTAREAVMGSAETATGRARSTASGIGQAGTEAGAHMGSAVSAVGDTIASAAGTTVDTVQQVPSLARQQAAGNPLAAGLIAFGGGLLLASLLPTTEREQQAVGPVKEALEPLAEQAKSVGSELKEELASSASQAAQAVKETASQAAEQVKSEAGSAGEQVKQEASSAASELRDQGEAGVENVRQQTGQSGGSPTQLG